MGLFINQEIHQNVFKNKEITEGPNQSYFRRDHLSELLKEQQENNNKLHQAILATKTLNEKQEVISMERFDHLSKQLHTIELKNDQSEKSNSQVVEQLKKLEENHDQLQVLIKQDQLMEHKIKDQLNSLTETSKKILKQIDVYETANHNVKEKVDEQQNLQKEIFTQLNKQGESQQELTRRLHNHEAITEKLIRQVEFIRSSLFERTAFLAEKIENGYFITSSYLTQLITGSPSIPKEIRLLDKQEKE